MADKIRVNTVSLGHTRDNVSSQVAKIRKQISALRGNVSQLNSMWEGEAHTAFQSKFTGDIAKLESLVDTLDGIVKYESNAKTEYEKCEKSVHALVDSINV